MKDYEDLERLLDQLFVKKRSAGRLKMRRTLMAAMSIRRWPHGGPNRRKPPEGGDGIPAVPPTNPKPLVGGAEAPLD